jgi:hypothetical protein
MCCWSVVAAAVQVLLLALRVVAVAQAHLLDLLARQLFILRLELTQLMLVLAALVLPATLSLLLVRHTLPTK